METKVAEPTRAYGSLKQDDSTLLAKPKQKMSFEEACAECQGITVKEFIQELMARIDAWPDA
ncbi:MAG: hypothetical protein LBL81_03690 [Tannerella sp.]|nr:hypothetical protein [Tannerella sp.]